MSRLGDIFLLVERELKMERAARAKEHEQARYALSLLEGEGNVQGHPAKFQFRDGEKPVVVMQLNGVAIGEIAAQGDGFAIGDLTGGWTESVTDQELDRAITDYLKRFIDSMG